MKSLFPILILLLFLFQAQGQSARAGKDFAIFFPVAEYEDSRLISLPNTVTNANAIARTLENKYGFQCEVRPNLKRSQIEAKLREYKRKFDNGELPANGQLLVFFLGHGEVEFGNGFFLPADANSKNLSSTALPHTYWRNFISSINCRHILVAIDACYSVSFRPGWPSMSGGRFGRSGELGDAEKVLADHERYQARIFFTSDAKEDKVPGESNFARKFLDGLNDPPTGAYLTSSQLFSNHLDYAQPAPLAGTFEGDQSESSFLFFRSDTVAGPDPIDPPPPDSPEDSRIKWKTMPGGVSWTMGNLSIPVPGSEQIDKDIGYGHLYTWEEAREACKKLNWELPSLKDWEAVCESYGGYGITGPGYRIGNPKDAYGQALRDSFIYFLAGFYNGSNKKNRRIDKDGFYWTATETSDKRKVYTFTFSKKKGIQLTEHRKGERLSCKCVYKK